MDSLTIQDAFAPYYADHDRTSRRDKRPPAKIGPAREPAAVALPSNTRLSDNKPDSTTEH
ncbi:hypothetical protein EN851_31455 [Mesorhizobium sp. M8A.F.Ca.ET.208.01.1.1]|uniref:hypothetical protein n=1 Tax=unclassified Mesorhizobium TaxID=325217 RepID=UPI00109374AF|nr:MULTISPECIES: hypothetical protein [unclassified Mesorhizobium]TGQ86241.1 hypothetical protein EN851_31455 [Mesorhizobium sp. M8A.F.Ca.ET.208.01.1.1]TGT47776.1 hypothetical protein EN810_31350 [Mesorhizobium sp. M8A.F.Ca.ET.167.01.1.1]